jgi:hypothetical protein
MTSLFQISVVVVADVAAVAAAADVEANAGLAVITLDSGYLRSTW